MAEPVRVVAVLGYSPRRGESLHVIAERRLRHAEGLAAGARAVVLSGWSRRPGGRGEGELMRAAWAGPPAELVVDTTARTTIENAVVVAAAAKRLAADEVVVVTSSWHRPRAGLLVRTALLGTGTRVLTASPHGAPPAALLLRELACLLALPVQLVLVRRGVRAAASHERQPSPGASAAGTRAPSHR